MENLNTFTVLSIDAWADSENDWTWNNWHKVGTVSVDINAPKAAILQALHEAGYITRVDGGDVEDDQYNLVIVDDSTREPLFAIEYGSAV